MNDPSTTTKRAEDEESDDLLAERYRLEQSLGEGGMGQVYSAEHVLMKKQVAIKVLRPELTEDEEIVARFQREAQAAAALDHPNVCQATDFGRNDEGAFFLVMEYLEGETLQSELEDGGRVAPERALHIARQIAAALDQAHQQGIVHRDLKPENVMLVDRHGDPDTVKIMDFGIARLIATAEEEGDEENGSARLTRQGVVYGTPHYMSPEQVAGEDVDARTDIYALGVVLFEMLTGTPPYDGDNIARVMGQHVTEPIPALAERCQQGRFPRSLEELLDRLLAKDADHRPQSAEEVIEAIDDIDLDRDVVISRPSPKSQATRRADAVTDTDSVQTTGTWAGLSSNERMFVVGLCAFFVVAAFSIVTAGAIYVVVWDSGERHARVVEENREELLDREQVAAAVDAARAGDRTELDELLDEHDDSAHLRYLSLDADLDAGRSVDLIDEASAIFELDDRYTHDPELVERLVARIHSGGDGEAARELLADHMSSTIRSHLAEVAREGSSSSARDSAYEFLEDQRQLRRLDAWERATAELRQASGCSEHKEKIDEVVAIGDARAIPTLEIYQNKSTRGCGRLRMSDCYGCIRGDLRDAVQALSVD